MNTVTITFSDGTSINAEQNGTSYIVNSKPDFPTDLTEVSVSGEDGDITLANVQIIECASVDSRYWFGMRELSAEELAKATSEAQILYTALMTDTLLTEV